MPLKKRVPVPRNLVPRYMMPRTVKTKFVDKIKSYFVEPSIKKRIKLLFKRRTSTSTTETDIGENSDFFGSVSSMGNGGTINDAGEIEDGGNINNGRSIGSGGDSDNRGSFNTIESVNNGRNIATDSSSNSVDSNDNGENGSNIDQETFSHNLDVLSFEPFRTRNNVGTELGPEISKWSSSTTDSTSNQGGGRESMTFDETTPLLPSSAGSCVIDENDDELEHDEAEAALQAHQRRAPRFHGPMNRPCSENNPFPRTFSVDMSTEQGRITRESMLKHEELATYGVEARDFQTDNELGITHPRYKGEPVNVAARRSVTYHKDGNWI